MKKSIIVVLLGIFLVAGSGCDFIREVDYTFYYFRERAKAQERSDAAWKVFEASQIEKARVEEESE